MRADVWLTQNGYAASRSQAKQLIEEGKVLLDGKPLQKASMELSEETHTVSVAEALSFVGRGGKKLEAALDSFALDVRGKKALDIGASTGGFTDCLLRRGAAFVWAVDSGSGQLAQALRADPRVCSMEHTNARYLESAQLGETVGLIVMDVSFISATYLLPRFPALFSNEGDAICLIKPQFEVGRSRIGKGGIVKDRAAHRFAVERVLSAGRECGLCPVGLIPSPIVGGDGNREFLVHFTFGRTDAVGLTAGDIRSVTG